MFGSPTGVQGKSPAGVAEMEIPEVEAFLIRMDS